MKEVPVNLFDAEPTDPKSAMLWNMEQERLLEQKSEETDDDIYEKIRLAHCFRLRQLNTKYPELVDSAEAEFEKLHELA